MPDEQHYPGGIISVQADDDLRLPCLLCDEPQQMADVLMLWRLSHSEKWQAVCVGCAINMLGNAIGAWFVQV